MYRLDRFWVGVAAALLAVALAGAVLLLTPRTYGAPVTLVESARASFAGNVLIQGAVASPGLYPANPDDRLLDLLQSAGGATSDADTAHIKLYVPAQGESSSAQHIDVNRAPAWLLETLPGIGADKAAAIMEYRNSHGPFRMLEDLLLVPGIGPATLDKARPYLTLGD